MGIIVKICGLSTLATVDAALTAGVDMVGFVHFERSPRHLTLEAARSLSEHVGDKARKVLLTVDMDDTALAHAVDVVRPHVLQLHGSEPPDRVASLKARLGLPIIKAIGIDSDPDDIDRIKLYDGVADMLLLDAASLSVGSQRPGGNGARFDWNRLATLKIATPWLLAGGLTPDNVAEAVGRVHASGVDVSSGVESGPGIKDAAKIAAFVANARAAAATRAA
jgi:phosphoribosylanthranilate isomerase